jgi:hypothetical protein
MKKNIRNVQVAGIGVLTPALMGQPQAAAARSFDPVEAVQTEPGSAADSPVYHAAKALMMRSIFDLSTVEKLDLGGRRIPALRIAKGQFKALELASISGPTADGACGRLRYSWMCDEV